MKSFRVYLLLGGVAVALLAAIQASYAADNKTGGNQPSAVDEKAARQDRGASFTSIMTPGNVQGAVSAVKTPKIPSTKPKNPPKTAIAGKKSTKQAVTAQIPTKSPVPGQSPVILVSHTSQVTGSVIRASLDRAGVKPVYKSGDKLAVNVNAAADCNILVFNYDSNGTLTQIFPNEYQQSGLVKAGESVSIGGADSPFDYQIAGKGGTEKIFVYAYPVGVDKPLEMALSQVPGSPFRAAEMTPEKYRELVNSSKSFFSREVKVIPKKHLQASASQDLTSANKIELTFSVEK